MARRSDSPSRGGLHLLNPVDRAVMYVSPEAGARRLQKRLQIAAWSAYDAASTSRRYDSWSPKTTNANGDVLHDLARLRARARDLVRNTPYACNATRVLSGRVVGTGIEPRFGGAGAQKVTDAWKWFAESSDFEGDTDLGGQMALACETMIQSGEALPVFRPAPSRLGLKVPLQIQLLEPDFIDDMKNEDDLPGGRRIIQGVEVDSDGRRLAVWLYNRHPGDSGSFRDSRRVPASALIHLFQKKRPGQLRAAPWMAPVMGRMRHMDDYDEAEIYAKKLQASYVAFITLLGEESPVEATDRGNPVEETEIGVRYRLNPGENVTLSSPPESRGYKDFTNAQLHALAAGLGLTYEMLTGDLSQVNYTSFKAGEITFRTYYDQIRWHLFVPRFCQRVYAEFLRVATAVGVIDGPPETVEWTCPRYESVDPEKDYKAVVTAVRSGLMSLKEAAAQQGYSLETIVKETKEAHRLLDQNGIVLDSDPRRTTAAGTPAQPAATTPNTHGGENGPRTTEPPR